MSSVDVFQQVYPILPVKDKALQSVSVVNSYITTIPQDTGSKNDCESLMNDNLYEFPYKNCTYVHNNAVSGTSDVVCSEIQLCYSVHSVNILYKFFLS